MSDLLSKSVVKTEDPVHVLLLGKLWRLGCMHLLVNCERTAKLRDS